MLISFETGCEVLTGWLGERGSFWQHGVVVFSCSAPSTFTCPLVLGTLNEDGSSKHDKLSAHKNNWAVFYLSKKIRKQLNIFACTPKRM